jgi:hypothetical protein
MAYTEDDINDLLRKAAEDYSPRDSESNWETILDRISPQNSSKKRAPFLIGFVKKYLGVLILVPLFVVGGLWIQHYRSDASIVSTPVAQKENENDSAGYKSANPSAKLSGSKNNSPHAKSVYTDALRNSTAVAKRPRRFFNREQGSAYSKPDLTDRTLSPKSFLYSLYLPINAKITSPLTDSIKTKPPIDYQQQKGTGSFQTRLHRRRGIYLGLVSAIDFSNVKSSAISHPGYAVGFIGRYKFNDRFDVETGLIFNKRNYNSDGRHFNMEKVRGAMPDAMHINSLYTTSSVIEIPIKFKYHFFLMKKSTLSASAGTSAYLMTAQQNDYDASMYGNDEQFTGMYTKNEFLLPAVLNIGLGYEYSISDRLNIGAEPFFKIPLRGMGIGNLPVTSAGVQLSVTRRFN